MTEIKKPCYEYLDEDGITECLEDGDRKCCHLPPPKNGTWANCEQGKLSPYYGSAPSEPAPPEPVPEWTDRLLALLERIATAQEEETEAWRALRDLDGKRIEYARNAEAIRQHTIEKEAEQCQERNAFLDRRVDAQHRAWLDAEQRRTEWNDRAEKRGQRELAALEQIAEILERKGCPK